MQPLDHADLQVIGTDQTTPIYWRRSSDNQAGEAGEPGTLTFERVSGEVAMTLATVEQFDSAPFKAGSVFESLEPGLVVQLAEGYFVLDEGDFPQ